jgi:peptidoglycan/xylan/chitin deacetylase (PgdA/CDA1 family)
MNRQCTDSRGPHLICYLFIVTLILISWGCAIFTPSSRTSAQSGGKLTPPTKQEIRSSDYVIVTAAPGDTYQSLARTYLGNERFSYLIEEFNRNSPINPGKVIVVPLKPVNPGGLYPDGYQTVPVLCYHRLSSKKNSSKITVSEENFDRQMNYLKNSGYHTLTLQEFLDFIDYKMRPPKKSVLITIDDGWKSARTIAMPILKKYGFNAVMVLYTGLVSSKNNPLTLSWNDVKVMKESGVFEFGSHTVTHSDLNKLSSEQLNRELSESQRVIYEKIGVKTDTLAYPDGLFDQNVITAMKKHGYRAGFTVIRGGNPFFNNPFALNRSMVYNSDKLDNFTKLLETYRRE